MYVYPLLQANTHWLLDLVPYSIKVCDTYVYSIGLVIECDLLNMCAILVLWPPSLILKGKQVKWTLVHLKRTIHKVAKSGSCPTELYTRQDNPWVQVHQCIITQVTSGHQVSTSYVRIVIELYDCMYLHKADTHIRVRTWKCTAHTSGRCSLMNFIDTCKHTSQTCNELLTSTHKHPS